MLKVAARFVEARMISRVLILRYGKVIDLCYQNVSSKGLQVVFCVEVFGVSSLLRYKG